MNQLPERQERPACGHQWHDNRTPCVTARAIARNHDAAREADHLASALLHDAASWVDALNITVTQPDRDRIDVPSFRWSRTRLAWVPRHTTIGPRRPWSIAHERRAAILLASWFGIELQQPAAPSKPRRVRMASVLVAGEVETVGPSWSRGPRRSDAVRGFTPWSVSGTGDVARWSVVDELAHRATIRRERTAYATWWRQNIRAAILCASWFGIDVDPSLAAPRREGRRARVISHVSAPVLADATTMRDACAAALVSDGRWLLQSGLVLTRHGERIALTLGPVTLRETGPRASGEALRGWVDRVTAAWHKQRAAILADVGAAQQRSAERRSAQMDYSLADVD